MKARPFPFEKLEVLTRPNVRLVNELLGAVDLQAMEGTLAGLSEALEPPLGQARLDFHSITRAHAYSPDPSCFVARLQLGDQFAYFLAESRVVEGMIQALHGDSVTRVGTHLSAADFGGMLFLLAKALPVLEKTGVGPIHVDTSRPHPGALELVRQRDDALLASWIISGEWGAGFVRLVGTASLWNGWRVRMGPPQFRPQSAGVQISTPIWLGSQNLGESDFRRLDAGDVIFLSEELPLELPLPVRLKFSRGDVGATLVLLEDSWKCAVNDPFEVIKETPVQESNEATSALNLSEVTVDVHVGNARTTLDQLARMQAGSIVELDTLMGDPVQLLVNGQRFAIGELVNVEGRLGVRLISKRR